MNNDPWLVPNRTVLSARLGLSRSYLWERTTIADNAPDDSDGLDIALWYAAALVAGAPLTPPSSAFPDTPRIGPDPTGDSIGLLIGLQRLRSAPFSAILAVPTSYPAEVVARAGAAVDVIADWHCLAVIAALDSAGRAALPAAVRADLEDWYGVGCLGELGAVMGSSPVVACKPSE